MSLCPLDLDEFLELAEARFAEWFAAHPSGESPSPRDDLAPDRTLCCCQSRRHRHSYPCGKPATLRFSLNVKLGHCPRNWCHACAIQYVDGVGNDNNVHLMEGVPQ